MAVTQPHLNWALLEKRILKHFSEGLNGWLNNPDCSCQQLHSWQSLCANQPLAITTSEQHHSIIYLYETQWAFETACHVLSSTVWGSWVVFIFIKLFFLPTENGCVQWSLTVPAYTQVWLVVFFSKEAQAQKGCQSNCRSLGKTQQLYHN